MLSGSKAEKDFKQDSYANSAQNPENIRDVHGNKRPW